MATSKKAQPKVFQPAVTRLLLIRHGEVEARYQKKFGGTIDMNLSPNGKRQAKVLADYLDGKRSPHEQTIFPSLREIDFGHWTSLGWQEVEAQFGFKSHEWLHQIQNHGVPGGESGKVFRQRVEPCLRQIIAQHPGENVAVFCHGGVIRMLLAILLKLPLPKTNHFDIEYASITQVALHPHMNEIELLNFTPWRDLVA